MDVSNYQPDGATVAEANTINDHSGREGQAGRDQHTGGVRNNSYANPPPPQVPAAPQMPRQQQPALRLRPGFQHLRIDVQCPLMDHERPHATHTHQAAAPTSHVPVPSLPNPCAACYQGPNYCQQQDQDQQPLPHRALSQIAAHERRSISSGPQPSPKPSLMPFPQLHYPGPSPGPYACDPAPTCSSSHHSAATAATAPHVDGCSLARPVPGWLPIPPLFSWKLPAEPEDGRLHPHLEMLLSEAPLRASLLGGGRS